MSLKDFEINKTLGKGAFGMVCLVKRKFDSKTYAMKRIKIAQLSNKEKENALNEIRILASLSHKNIIGYKDAFFDQKSKTLNIVMEFANDGDMSTKIKYNLKHGLFFSEDIIWHYLVQIIEGLNYLHDKKIIHRDLKSANIFLMKDNTIKIGDLNVSKVNKLGMAYTQTGTPYYASPEIWLDKPYDYKSDIWSLGCILYELCMLKPPFRGTSLKNLCINIQKGIYNPIPNFYSEDLKNIIGKMLQREPEKRLSTIELLQCDIIVNKIKELKINMKNNGGEEKQNLIATIRVPRNMVEINKALPKNKYNNKQVRKEMLMEDEYETNKRKNGFLNDNDKKEIKKICEIQNNNFNNNNNYINNNINKNNNNINNNNYSNYKSNNNLNENINNKYQINNNNYPNYNIDNNTNDNIENKYHINNNYINQVKNIYDYNNKNKYNHILGENRNNYNIVPKIENNNKINNNILYTNIEIFDQNYSNNYYLNNNEYMNNPNNINYNPNNINYNPIPIINNNFIDNSQNNFNINFNNNNCNNFSFGQQEINQQYKNSENQSKITKNNKINKSKSKDNISKHKNNSKTPSHINNRQNNINNLDRVNNINEYNKKLSLGKVNQNRIKNQEIKRPMTSKNKPINKIRKSNFSNHNNKDIISNKNIKMNENENNKLKRAKSTKNHRVNILSKDNKIINNNYNQINLNNNNFNHNNLNKNNFKIKNNSEFKRNSQINNKSKNFIIPNSHNRQRFSYQIKEDNNVKNNKARLYTPNPIQNNKCSNMNKYIVQNIKKRDNKNIIIEKYNYQPKKNQKSNINNKDNNNKNYNCVQKQTKNINKKKINKSLNINHCLKKRKSKEDTESNKNNNSGIYNYRNYVNKGISQIY